MLNTASSPSSGRRTSANIVEQDHRAIKRIARPMLGIKTFRCARAVIAGIETMHMIKKGQLQCPDGQASSAADKSYPWPSDSKPLLDAVQPHALIATESSENPFKSKT